MVQQVLAPGVQHRQKAGLRSQMTRVGGDLLQRLGHRAEQQAVKYSLILQGQRCELVWHSEDYVAVWNGQQLFGPLRQPTIAGR